MSLSVLIFAALVADSVPPADPAALTRIEATCLDYIDGQLEGDPVRVARSLHPDLAKRAIAGETPDERLGLHRMTREELTDLTRRGTLRTPREQWSRSCHILDTTRDTASVRLETPWFVDYFHMGRFGDRWVIVNALWHPIPRPTQGAEQPSGRR